MTAEGIVTKYFVPASHSVMRFGEEDRLVMLLGLNHLATLGTSTVYAVMRHPWQR